MEIYTTNTGDRRKDEDFKRLSARYRMARVMSAPKPKGEKGYVDAWIAVGMVLGLLLFGLLLIATARDADAGNVRLTSAVTVEGSRPGRLVQLHGPRFEQMGRNPVIYVEHVMRKWHYFELADGSEWMVTRCPEEDSDNCYWNARIRGNHRGHSFVNIHGHIHFVRTASQP